MRSVIRFAKSSPFCSEKSGRSRHCPARHDASNRGQRERRRHIRSEPDISRELAKTPWRPNLFVVGAPKCGTTSLCHYLGLHPQIFVSRIKEPLFFCDDLPHEDVYRRTADPDSYLALFEPGTNAKWRGEGTIWYLMSSTAARRIRKCSPGARIIIVLRNPVDMVSSLHAQFLFSGNENIRSFEKAYAAQAARAKGHRIPWRAHAPFGLLYTRVGRYADQVERYLETFPSHQVKVLIFEELFADIAVGYRETLHFLDVDAGFAPGFTVRNERHNVRSPSLQRLLIKGDELWFLPWHLPPGRLRDGLQRRLDRLNLSLRKFNGAGCPPAPLSPELRLRVHRDFARDIARLEELLGRDLSVWKRKNLRGAASRIGASGNRPGRLRTKRRLPEGPPR